MRLAIFGGTFDPIHEAHLAVAKAAADRFELDRVLLVPAASPPHKAGARAPYEDRLAMVQLAAAADPRFEASELEREEPRSYSILTIEKVRARLAPGDELFFVIGADAFAEIGTWFRREDVIAAVTFIVVARPGHSYEVPPGARVLPLDKLALPASSSEVRAQLARGARPDDVPDAVYDYIRTRGLYRGIDGVAIR